MDMIKMIEEQHVLRMKRIQKSFKIIRHIREIVMKLKEKPDTHIITNYWPPDFKKPENIHLINNLTEAMNLKADLEKKGKTAQAKLIEGI